MHKIPFFHFPLLSILKVYRLSIYRVLPYSFTLALLYILMEPQTKPTFVDTTDWIALFLFIMGIFVICMLHACIIYQFAGSIKLSFYKTDYKTDPEDSDDLFSVIGFGITKTFPVLFISILYIVLVFIGLVAFIVPGLFLLSIGAQALLLIVLKDTNPKDTFVEAYFLTVHYWFSCLFALITLFLFSWGVEALFDRVFREQVVVAMFFSVVIRGCLWAFWYATLITLLLTFVKTRIIEGSLNLKFSHQNRKQKFLHTAPNQ